MFSVLRAIGLGIFGWMFPRILVYAGVPLDLWAQQIGQKLAGANRMITNDQALTVVSLIMAVILFTSESWWRPLRRKVASLRSNHGDLRAPAPENHKPPAAQQADADIEIRKYDVGPAKENNKQEIKITLEEVVNFYYPGRQTFNNFPEVDIEFGNIHGSYAVSQSITSIENLEENSQGCITNISEMEIKNYSDESIFNLKLPCKVSYKEVITNGSQETSGKVIKTCEIELSLGSLRLNPGSTAVFWIMNRCSSYLQIDLFGYFTGQIDASRKIPIPYIYIRGHDFPIRLWPLRSRRKDNVTG